MMRDIRLRHGLMVLLMVAIVWVYRPVEAELATPPAPQTPPVDLDWAPAEPGTQINTPGQSAGQPKVAVGADEDRLMIVYDHWVNGNRNDRDIFYAESTNNGQSWTAAAAVNVTNGIDSFAVAIDYDSNNTAHIVWVELDTQSAVNRSQILYARKPAGGAWTSPVALSSLTSNDPDPFPIMGTPRIVASGNNILDVVWFEADQTSVTNPTSDIFHARSINGGDNWTNNGRITPNITAPESLDPDIHVDGGGRVHVVWQESSGGINSNIHYVRSSGTPSTATFAWQNPNSPVTVNLADPLLEQSRRPRVVVENSIVYVSFTLFFSTGPSTTQFGYIASCGSSCNQLSGWGAFNASGQGVDVNSSDPFNLATTLTDGGGSVFMYFHGAELDNENDPEQVRGVNSCTNWSTSGVDVATSTGLRAIFPEVAVRSDWLHLVYEWIDIGAGNEHRIYHMRAPFDCSFQIFLPVTIAR